MIKKKKVTMDDIASQLGISKNSVSVALNGKYGVSEDLRKQILSTANQLQYGVYAHQFAESGCQYVVIITPEYIGYDTFFYDEIIWAIENETQKQNCIPMKYIISRQVESDLEPPSLRVPLNTCRFLVIGILSEKYMRLLCDLGMPIISVDISYSHFPIGYVGTSNFEGGFLATEYLISQNHKKIGFIGPVFTAESVYERWNGFQKALIKAKLEINEDFCIIGEDKSEDEGLVLFNTVESIEGYLDKLAGGDPPTDARLSASDTPSNAQPSAGDPPSAWFCGSESPSAWFCGGDRTAVALLNYLTKKGVKVPEDVSIMGFDDIPIAQMVMPQLTTMKVDRKQMGKLAVQYLLGNHFLSTLDISITLSSNLVIRDSVRNNVDTPAP